MKIYRTEFPNPQFERKNWLCLNGEWEFETDPEMVGLSKNYQKREHFNEKINVPFCPESDLSGIGCKDFMPMVWYKRTVSLPERMIGKRVFLHFGAVDHRARVFAGGKLIAEHTGGYVPFSVEVTELGSSFDVVVCAEDDMPGKECCYGYGKQSHKRESYDSSYTRTTGIWQSVWLEAVGERYIGDFKITPSVGARSIALDVETKDAYGAVISAEAFYEGRKVGQRSFCVTDGCASVEIPLSELHLWELGKGRLYDLKLTMAYNGEIADEVKSYFGMRSVCFDGMKFLLNGKSVFGRFALDQGFYPDGIYTAPEAERFLQDIELATDLGFNGARLHEKIFEPLALYYCDKMGYMVWVEYPDWGMNRYELDAIVDYIPEWISVLKRDYNHPSVIGWCCRNEVWDVNGRRIDTEQIRIGYEVTKLFDRTRPVIDTSGGVHTLTDTFDVHDYEGDLKAFEEKYSNGIREGFPGREKYQGQPYWLSEYGGIKYTPFDERKTDGWGYGNSAESEEAFISRFTAMTDAVKKNPNVWATCYTQLYDVEQEKNGLYTYERRSKFSPEGAKKIRECNEKKAAIED